jgi:hypothetical protein
MPFLTHVMEAVFYEGVQHRLRFCLDHLICVNMAVNKEKKQRVKHTSRMGGDLQVCFYFGTKILCGSQFFCRQSLGGSLRNFTQSPFA